MTSGQLEAPALQSLHLPDDSLKSWTRGSSIKLRETEIDAHYGELWSGKRKDRKGQRFVSAIVQNQGSRVECAEKRLGLKRGTQPSSQFGWCEFTFRLTHPAPGMHPTRFNRVEPRAYDWEQMGEQTWFIRCLRRSIVRSYPGAQGSTFVPTGVVPKHDHHAFAFCTCHR